MIEKLLSITKSSEGFFTGLYKSKKFALATVWTFAALAYPEIVPPWVGAAVAAAYILGQSVVEGLAVRVTGSAVPEENGATAEPKPKP